MAFRRVGRNCVVHLLRRRFYGGDNLVDFNQNIIRVLNDIQSERGEYFQRRQNINHDIRNEKEFAEKIAKTLPENYSAQNINCS